MHWIPGMPRDSASTGVRFFGGGSSHPSGTTTTTQNAVPWAPQQPLLEEGFGSANNLFENYTPSYFPNSTVAPFDPAQTAGQNAELNLGINGTPAVNAAGSYLTNLEGGGYMANPGNVGLTPFLSGSLLSDQNPYFKATVNDITSSVEPQLTSTFNQGNEMNNPNSAFAVSQGITNAISPVAFQNYQQGIQNALTASGVLSNNWNTGVQDMTQGSIFAPGIQTANMQDVAAIQDAGNQRQQQTQAQINDQINRFNFGQQEPYNKVATFMDMINGNYGGTSTTSQPYYANNSGIGSLLGALAAGGAAYMSGGSLVPAMMAGGMLGGSAGSMFRA